MRAADAIACTMDILYSIHTALGATPDINHAAANMTPCPLQ